MLQWLPVTNAVVVTSGSFLETVALSLSTPCSGVCGLNEDSAEVCLRSFSMCSVGCSVLFNTRTLNFGVVNGDSPQVTRAETAVVSVVWFYSNRFDGFIQSFDNSPSPFNPLLFLLTPFLFSARPPQWGKISVLCTIVFTAYSSVKCCLQEIHGKGKFQTT